jgi:hypothetical protein
VEANWSFGCLGFEIRGHIANLKSHHHGMPPWVGSFKATADDASSALTVLLLLADGSDF